MALQSSGAISLNDIHVEAGGTTGTEASLNDSDIRGLIDKLGQNPNSFNEYYGASAFNYEDSSGAVSGAVPDGGPYYTIMTSSNGSGTVLSAGTYNFVMVGQGGDAAGSAASISFWQIQLNGTEAWTFNANTIRNPSSGIQYTKWQIAGDSTCYVWARNGTNNPGNTSGYGTKGTSSRITKYADRQGGAAGGVGAYSASGGGSVDFFNLSNKADLNGIQGGTSAGLINIDPNGGKIKETGNPASGTKWLNNLSDTDFDQASGYYANITTGGSYGNYGQANYEDGFSPFGGAGAGCITDYSSSGNVYANVVGRNGGYGGGGSLSRHTTLSNPKTASGVGGAPALWYLRVGS